MVSDNYCNINLLFFSSFGFIRFDDIDLATKALKKHNGVTVDGRELELRYAEDRSGGGGTPGGGRGGGGGRGRGRGGRGGESIIIMY